MLNASKSLILVVAALAIIAISPRAARGDELDFGNVLVMRKSTGQTWTISNSSTNFAFFQMDVPTLPFVAETAANMRHQVAPKGSLPVTFAFQSPMKAMSDADFSTNLSYTLTDDVNGTVLESGTLNLKAHMVEPEPINPTKEAATAGEPFHLNTTMSWESSTGNIDDLKGEVTIQEMIVVQQGCLPASGTVGPIRDLDNDCSSVMMPRVQTPPPWVPKYFGVTNWGQTWGPDADETSIFFPGEMWINDGHGTDIFATPFSATNYSIVQTYYWSAPWRLNNKDCQQWTPLLQDTIFREVRQVDGRWVCRVTSDWAGSKDFGLADVAITHPGFTSFTVNWITQGAQLQLFQPGPSSYWQTISLGNATQFNVNEGFFYTTADELANLFNLGFVGYFRLKVPQ